MREAAIDKHPHLPKTPTFLRGDRLGRVPVDGCWITPDLATLKAGWLAVHKCPGDHRCPIIEIDSKVLLGDNMLRIAKVQARRLSTKIKKAVMRYSKKLDDHLIRHKVLPKLHKVYAGSTTKLSPDQAQEMETIDRVRSEGMTYAEKRCRKYHTGQVECSPEIAKAFQLKKLWNKIVWKKRGR
jgi:hypothetical protein